MATIKINVSKNEVSDGYHTLQELYDHRAHLFILLCLQNKDKCVWKHFDPDYFILYYKSEYGQLSYHIEKKYLYLVSTLIKENPHFTFDGHTSKSVLARLSLLSETIDKKK